MATLFLSLVAGVILVSSVSVAASVENLASGGQFKVVEVIDGDTVVLENGRQVRLVGIQAPKLPLGRKGFKKWPLADQSKKILTDLSLGKMVTLRFGGAKEDRHRRILAHLITGDGLWLQGVMLAQGMARVYSFPDNRAQVTALYRLENQARRQNRGIWAHPFYALRDPERTTADIGTFQIVEGTVVNAANVKGTVYLNFSSNWRQDFTIKIKSKARRLFEKMGINPLDFEGQKVRVRGWLKKENGPMIKVTHPEQLEPLNR